MSAMKPVNQRINVFYSPTSSNEKVVHYLRLQPGLRECEFIQLPTDPKEMELRLLEAGRADQDPSAFIFGDGNEHTFSYHFTKLSGVKLKIGIDAHSDYKTPEPGIPPRCGSHMGFTCEDGIDVVVPWHGHLPVGYFERLVLGRVENVDEQFMPNDRYIQYLLELVRTFAGKRISLTTDCDVIPAFPAQVDWLTPAGAGIRAEAIAGLISSIGSDLVRLDLGGLAFHIPDFDLVQPLSLVIPTTRETYAFLGYRGDSRADPRKEMFDRVGSYVVAVYTRLLEAFLHVHMESR